MSGAEASEPGGDRLRLDSEVARTAGQLLLKALEVIYDRCLEQLRRQTAVRRGSAGSRTDEVVWSGVHQLVRRQMVMDRDKGLSRAPDRVPQFHPGTFVSLLVGLRTGQGIGFDQQRIVEATIHLAYAYRLPPELVGQLREVVRDLWRVSRASGDGGKSKNEFLHAVSERALDVIALLDQGISLSDLYIARGHEEPLARSLVQQVRDRQPGQPVHVVLGDAGTGKTSMLWYLAGLLESRATSSKPGKGTVLRPVLLRSEELLTRTEEQDLVTLLDTTSKSTTGHGRVVLMDSADVLLHSADGRRTLSRVVDVCQKRQLPLVVTCRTRDRGALKDLLGTTPCNEGTQIEGFGADELERAITAYCAHYLSEQSPRNRAETAGALMRAAVRGLPIREVVARPLTLRMLFEVYAPDSPKPEIDAGGLYDAYWAKKVITDARQGSASHSSEGSPDLSWPAQGLARLMLADGVVSLPGAGLPDRLPHAVLPPTEADLAMSRLAALERRGVVHGIDALGHRSTQFFHQTLYEYAAGRCLRDLADHRHSYYEKLGDHLQAHPDDFLRAVVAEQALVQGVRSGGPAKNNATDLLVRLLDSEDVDLQVIAVRAYALLPELYDYAQQCVHTYLPSAPQSMVEELLAILPSVKHRQPVRVARDLKVVLRHHDGMQRRALDLLCRFGRVDRSAADAVWSMLYELCGNRDRCFLRRRDADDEGADGCGTTHCLWSWLVRLDSNDAGSHGNHAVRLVDALAEHHGRWAADRMAELIALAERHGARRQVWQCVLPIHRRADQADWAGLLDAAARVAERLGGNPARATRREPTAKIPQRQWEAVSLAEEAEQAQQVLEAHWFSTSIGTPPDEIIRELAGEGPTFFDVPPQRLHAVLAQVGRQLRTRAAGVVELLEETVRLCSRSDKIDQVARHLLVPLLAPPYDEPGTDAAARWCSDRLGALGARTPVPAGTARGARFAAAGVSRLPLERITQIVPWPVKGAWPERKKDTVFFTSDSASALLVPLAAAGHSRGVSTLRRWRVELEGGRFHQAAKGSNDWPAFCDGERWHKARRNKLNELIHRSLVDHAPHRHQLLADAVSERIPSADVPWIAALAKQTAEQPASVTYDAARAALARYGTELARWCSELWAGAPCPDPDVKLAALRLWGDLVRLGAAERPSLAEQAALAASFGAPQWAGALSVLRHWNSPEVAPLPGPAGEVAWEEMDTALASVEKPARGEASVGLLRCFLHCRFAPLTSTAYVQSALAAAQARIDSAPDSAGIHDSGVGFLAERLCGVDPAQAVELVLHVARHAARPDAADPHHVTRLGWLWQKPLIRLSLTADRAQWQTLVSGLSEGPLSMLQKTLDIAAARRRDEDVRADAERLLVGSRYREEAMAGLRDAAVRHRRTPLEDRAWPDVLAPVAPERTAN